MKAISMLSIGLATAALLFVGCSEKATPEAKTVSQAAPTISEESLGLRKTTLNDENVAPRKTQYGKSTAGSGYKIERAFQDAPPMIPHDVEGMIPVTIKNNACIGCHAPEVASSSGATPYPPSHMTNFRPQHSYAIKGENTSSEKLAHISIEKENKLVGARFNCTQCHAPQSEGDLAVANNFVPDYTSADGAHKSSWNGTKLMEGINTYDASK
jgi:cytochrome c-type protein NapB